MQESLSTDKYHRLWVLLQLGRDALYKARMKELSQYGISTMEAAVMFVIQSLGDKATPAEISRWILRKHHTVTALLKRMEKKGLVTQARVQGRKKIWRVSLTEKGQKIYRQSAKRKSIKLVMSHLSDNECQQLESCLRKILHQALKQTVKEPIPPFP